MKTDVDVVIASTDAHLRVAIDQALALVQTSAKVWAVGDGRKVVSRLTCGRIDCLVLDADLPGPDATLLVSHIREQGFDVPILLLISPSAENAGVMAPAGVTECIDKTELATARGARRLASAIRVGVAEALASRAEKELARRAIYDQLTGLPNRFLLLDRLHQLIAIAGRDGHFVALLMMDLDGFGGINKSLGHDVGDRLLQEVSARLRAVARDSDTVARVDGNSFACVVTTGTHQAGAMVVADKVRQAMARPFVIQGRELAIRLRIGIAVYPLHATDGATLLRRAVSATAAAKQAPTGVETFAGDDGHDLRRLSPLTLQDRRFPDEVSEMLDRGEMPPQRLTFEITEGAIMSDIPRATETLRRLAEMGVHISIDDFGTGYSSLANLQRMPVEEIKVDKSFVSHMATRADDAVIVRSVIELGRNLGLHVVAEGVEDQETWQRLAGLGCPLVQGYYIGRPVDATTMTAWLHRPPWGVASRYHVREANPA